MKFPMAPELVANILRAGGSVTVNQLMAPALLENCAVAAQAGGSMLTVKITTGMSPELMVQIARAAPGHVTFDLSV